VVVVVEVVAGVPRPPQGGEVGRNIEAGEVPTGHPDMLQLRHQLAVKAAHGVTRQEPDAPLRQVPVDPSQLGLQVSPAPLVLVDEQLLEPGVDVLYDAGNLLVLDEEVVAPRHGLHDVPLDPLVLQHRHASVDQDRRRSGVEVRPEIRRGLEHVHRGDLQGDRLQLRQQVQVHEILLAEEASTLPPAVYSGGPDNQLYLGNLASGHLALSHLALSPALHPRTTCGTGSLLKKVNQA